MIKNQTLIASANVTEARQLILGQAVNPNFWHREISPSGVKITATTLMLDQSLVPETTDLIVHAEIVTIRGKIRIPSKTISIFAKTVVGNNGEIDVAGLDGEGFQPGFANRNGSSFGQQGSQGDPGADGKDAGKITIYAQSVTGTLFLCSDGGKGGRGQDGGSGAVGSPGSNGKDASDQPKSDISGESGSQGGTGGAAGPGGRGGSGGKGGQIEVFLIDVPASGVISISAKGGLGGDGGTSGTPGDGGPGGRGGINRKCRKHCEPGPRPGPGVFGFTVDANTVAKQFVVAADAGNIKAHSSHSLSADLAIAESTINSDCEWICLDNGRAANGATGNPGSVASSGLQGDAGASLFDNAGRIDYSTAVQTIDWKTLASRAYGPQLLMSLHEAELAYLNAKIPECVSILSWLSALNAGAGLPEAISEEEWIAVGGRIAAMISQLNCGLDFYGYPRNCVPLVALDTYTETVTTILNLSFKIEESYVRYLQAQQDNQAKLDALNKALGEAQDLASRLEIEKEDISRRKDDIEKLIVSLLGSMQQQEQVLLDANTAFKRAVENKAGNACAFPQILTTIASVVSVGMGAYQNVVGIVSQVKTLADKGLALRNVVESVKIIGKDVNDLRQAYSELAAKLSANPDAAKIVIGQEDYKEMLAPYKDLPDAQNYKRQIETYIGLCESRNQKVLEISSLIIRYYDLTHAIAHLQEEIVKIRSSAATVKDPTLVECVVFMGRLLTATKSQIVRCLYQEHRALEYWALSEMPFQIDDQDVARLAAKHTDVLQSELRSLERRSRANQSFTGVRVLLSADKMAQEFELFRQTGRLAFTLQLDEEPFRKEWSSVTVKEVKISVPNAATSDPDNRISIILVHSGTSSIKDQGGKVFQFVHLERSTNIIYSLKDGSLVTSPENNLGGRDGQYAEISPFAAWTILVLPAFNKGLNLTKVKSINLEFSGYFLAT